MNDGENVIYSQEKELSHVHLSCSGLWHWLSRDQMNFLGIFFLVLQTESACPTDVARHMPTAQHSELSTHA